MRTFTEYLTERFVKDAGNTADMDVRAKIGFLEAWVSIVSNTLLAALKIVLGLWLNSISLLADAAHTASDVITSVVVLVGFRAARLPADEEHPYGHGRVETITTLIIAILLAFVGFEFAKGSVQRLITGAAVRGSFAVAGIMAAGGLFKEWLARFSVALGRKIASPVLIADAWHHRSDAIASVMVAVAIVASAYGYSKVDAVFGLIVSGLILYTGWELGRGACNELIGRKPDPATVERISRLAAGITGVEGVHKIDLHDYGGGNKIVSLHIQVDECLPVRKAHNVAAQVECSLRENMGFETTVHVEPAETDGPE
ncbi:MAG: cation diffusion facilitator family transporter [bacterium]|jgi:cation diffusion facilitator family transporter